MSWIAGILLLLGFYLFLSAGWQRRRAGFGRGTTVSHDDVRLVSKRLGLVGQPDRLVEVGGYIIPEEKKPGLQVYDSYRAQLGIYLVLVEEVYGQSPPYGVIVLGDGRRVKIENSADLQTWVLDLASDIRGHRETLECALDPPEQPSKCRACGLRSRCSQRLV